MDEELSKCLREEFLRVAPSLEHLPTLLESLMERSEAIGVADLTLMKILVEFEAIMLSNHIRREEIAHLEDFKKAGAKIEENSETLQSLENRVSLLEAWMAPRTNLDPSRG